MFINSKDKKIIKWEVCRVSTYLNYVKQVVKNHRSSRLSMGLDQCETHVIFLKFFLPSF